MKHLVTLALLAAIAAAGAGGILLGVQLGERASRPGHERLVITAPEAYAAPAEGVLRSAGGFTGFGGTPALAGDVARVAPVEELEPGSQPGAGRIALGGEDGRVLVAYSSPARLFSIRALGRPLAEGDLVLVRFEGNEVTGVLRVPADLEEGIGAGVSPRQQRSGAGAGP